MDFVGRYKGKLYFIRSDPNELIDTFMERVWFIIKNEPTEGNFEKVNILSRIFVNKKFLGCQYSIDTEKKCKEKDV